MKRLLATLAAMVAGGALATTVTTNTPSFYGSIDFNAYAAGTELTALTAEGETGNGTAVTTTDYFFWETSGESSVAFGTVTNGQLAVDSNKDVVLRRLVEGGAAQWIEVENDYNSIYFDADVTFTAMDGDSSPDLSPEDKLVVWMKESAGVTNIMITSAVLDPNDNYSFSTSNEFVAVEACDGTAVYHLTVKAYRNIGIDDEIPVPGFKVEIDGREIQNAVYNGYFASMVNYGANNWNKLKGLAFSGTGAIDNIQMASVTEVPEETDFTFAVTVTDEESVNQGVAIHYGEVEEQYEADYTKALPVGYNESVTFVITADDATVTYVVGAGEAKSAEYDEEEGTFTFTVTAAAFEGVGVGETLTVAITVTAGEEPPTPSGTHTIDPATESLDESGTLPVEAGTTTIKIDDYNVTEAFEFNEAHTAATLKPLVVADSAAEEGDAFVIDDDSVTINVNPVAGLYYGVDKNTDLGALARPATLKQFTGSNKAAIFTVEKPEGTSGFFKVYVDIKATK